MSLTKSSVQVELDRFYKSLTRDSSDFETITRSAFTQSRKKLLSTNPSQRGFDHYITVGGFKITCLNSYPSTCSSGGTSFKKNYDGWNNITSDKCVSSNSIDIISLATFLTKKEDNLILFVNGYRNNAQDDWNSNEDYGSITGVRFYDFYTDSDSYWGGMEDSPMKMDQRFINQIGTKNVVYIDGHASIVTSNHAMIHRLDTKTFLPIKNSTYLTTDINLAKCNFSLSALASLRCLKNNDPQVYNTITVVEKGIYLADETAGCTWDDDDYEYNQEVVNNYCDLSSGNYNYTECEKVKARENAQIIKDNTDFMNITPNKIGYKARYNAGWANGVILYQKIKSGEIPIKKDVSGKIIGKIDIVAHSMGYAHAQGVIDYLISKEPTIKFGIFYILAPENACSGTTFKKEYFEEVWQYGVNEMKEDAWYQDGIAPQCAVPGLSFSPVKEVDGKIKYGRIEFPQTGTYAKYRNFLYGHYGASYEWIFTTINSNQKGYVTPR
jgi:hypothetical protein